MSLLTKISTLNSEGKKLIDKIFIDKDKKSEFSFLTKMNSEIIEVKYRLESPNKDKEEELHLAC